MGLNSTPSSHRIHIGFFGKRNAGKSSLINALTDQELSVVSDIKGTTTDPVYKAMELLPLGPVLIMDTPGYDDQGELGQKRVQKTREVMDHCDIGVVIIDGTTGMDDADKALIRDLKEREIQTIVVVNKADLKKPVCEGDLAVSALTGYHIRELKEMLAALSPKKKERPLVSDLIKPNDFVVLVIPIDESAPKGRIILPQQQVIRDCLDTGAVPVCCKETELEEVLKRLKPSLVITDSQIFDVVDQMVPSHIRLTSFSILMARYKGLLESAVKAVEVLSELKDHDRVLISEGCTHHRQCADIGTVKIPQWIHAYTDAKVQIDTTSGRTYPQDLTDYRLVIHCGGCTLNEKEMQSRQKRTLEQGVPIINYGIAIAAMKGILSRCLDVFYENK